MRDTIDFLIHALIFDTIGICAIMILSLFFKFLPRIGGGKALLGPASAGLIPTK